MKTYALRYTPDSDLAKRYPGPSSVTFRTREQAEEIRRACINGAQMEVVEAEA